ncbi:MAG: polysaccharide biosynthesis/export family protein [Planctomycetota bacterium]|jgi:polysaccharide export outer membrane protein
MMANIRALAVVILSSVTLGVAGCFSSNPADIEAFVKPYQVHVTAGSYVLQPPDEIEIHCSAIAEIDEQRQRIRPDGKVSFENLGEIEAAGKTPKQVADALKAAAAVRYRLADTDMPDVRVVVYQSSFYYVLGEVYFPGAKVRTGRDTALTALAQARPTVLAWQERIQVIRPSREENVKPKIFEVDLKRMAVHGDISKDVMLQEGDIIYVPPTVLAAIAMKVEEFIRPIARAFTGVYIVQGDPYGRSGY